MISPFPRMENILPIIFQQWISQQESVLRDCKTGKIITELTRANIDLLLAMNYKQPEAFTATGRDGVTTIYGAIWKPSNFDATKKYPVIDQTYTGPHTYMFPKNFVSGIARSNSALAELGFHSGYC